MCKTHLRIYTTDKGDVANRDDIETVVTEGRSHPLLRRLRADSPAVVYDSPGIMIIAHGTDTTAIDDFLRSASKSDLAVTAAGAGTASSAVTPSAATPELPPSGQTPAFLDSEDILTRLQAKIDSRAQSRDVASDRTSDDETLREGLIRP